MFLDIISSSRACLSLTIPANICGANGVIFKSIVMDFRLLEHLAFEQCVSLLACDFACLGDLSQLRSLNLSGCVVSKLDILRCGLC